MEVTFVNFHHSPEDRFISTEVAIASFQRTDLFELLCAICIREVPDADVKTLTNDEWEDLWALSIRHKVAPILVSSLRANKITIPDNIEARVSEYTRNNLLNAMRHSAELVRLTVLFNENQIRFLGFKGMALVGLLGLALDQRHCGDMDILLIDPEDLVLADKLLRTEGYQRQIKVQTATLANTQALTDFNTKDFKYIHAERKIELELHIALFHTNMLSVTPNEMYGDRAEIMIGSNSVPVMNREDHALYLLLHGSISVWHRLKWLLDIPLVSNYGRDYMEKDFFTRSEKLGVQRMVLQGIALAHRFLGMPVSDNIASKLNGSFIDRALCGSAARVLRTEKSAEYLEGWRFVVYRLFTCCVYWPTLRPEISFKIACINTFFISLRDYEALPLPPYLRWLYYPLRPFLWMWRSFR